MDVIFCRLCIDDTFYFGGGTPKQCREEQNDGGRSSVGHGQQGRATGSDNNSLGSGLQEVLADSTTNDDVESSPVTRRILWRVEASHSNNS